MPTVCKASVAFVFASKRARSALVDFWIKCRSFLFSLHVLIYCLNQLSLTSIGLVHVSQAKLKQIAMLSLACLSDRAGGPGSISSTDVKVAIECTQPPDTQTAAAFCNFISYLTIAERVPPGWELVAAEGGVAVVVQLLARWRNNDEVVKRACTALYHLANEGSGDIHCAMKSAPDVEALLRSSSARLQACGKTWYWTDSNSDFAAQTLKLLGY